MTSIGAACKPNKPGYYGKGSVEVSKPTNDTDGPTRRLAISADKLVTQPFAGIDTVYDVLQYVAKTHGTRDALGWRDIVDVHEEAKEVTKTVDGKEVKETKKWKYFQLSGYKYITYVQLKDQVDEIARGLVGAAFVFVVAWCAGFASTYPLAVAVFRPLRVLGARLSRTFVLPEPCAASFTSSLCAPSPSYPHPFCFLFAGVRHALARAENLPGSTPAPPLLGARCFCLLLPALLSPVTRLRETAVFGGCCCFLSLSLSIDGSRWVRSRSSGGIDAGGCQALVLGIPAGAQRCWSGARSSLPGNIFPFPELSAAFFFAESGSLPFTFFPIPFCFVPFLGYGMARRRFLRAQSAVSCIWAHRGSAPLGLFYARRGRPLLDALCALVPQLQRRRQRCFAFVVGVGLRLAPACSLALPFLPQSEDDGDPRGARALPRIWAAGASTAYASPVTLLHLESLILLGGSLTEYLGIPSALRELQTPENLMINPIRALDAFVSQSGCKL
ncbi:hypothetical protein B0H16DRAFT_1888517 [Mycena metata]|uniref:Uncharacterized protein n=1 Tax=Mycena metata TaxID=1033252 RepID=A0AAD7IRF6_9AGAR|nr:hypothetical protein B0H16DRAFT_1888517 [Mycena metata]